VEAVAVEAVVVVEVVVVQEALALLVVEVLQQVLDLRVVESQRVVEVAPLTAKALPAIVRRPLDVSLAALWTEER
jgi:hypothetical protein